MAMVRDPAFWRRFSLAVHREEKMQIPDESALESQTAAVGPGSLKQTDSWLDREQRKKNRYALICWAFWIIFAALLVGIVLLVLWLKGTGVFAHKQTTQQS